MLMLVVAIGSVFVTLFSIFIGQRLGLWNLTLAKTAHDLNVRRSLPKIGTEIWIEQRQVHPANFSPFSILRVSIYNAGEFAAKQLKGQCELICPGNSVQQFTIPIDREFLDSTRPYELEPYRIEGIALERIMAGAPNQLMFNVNIEFDYFGLSPDEPEHYSASCHFDSNSRRLIKD
jgi:hypothetical protein